MGVFLSIGVLEIIEKHLFINKYKRYQSGNYYTILATYEDEKTYGGNIKIEGESQVKALEITHRKTIYAVSYFDWIVQFLVWNVIVVISKTLLFLI